MRRKGILLAGGRGSRLFPMTRVVSKQLLPLYNKPMIYYPLALLLRAGIREILIITTPQDLWQYQQLLGDGSSMGAHFSWAAQGTPKGIAEALLIAQPFLKESPSLLVLGDNVFHGAHLHTAIAHACLRSSGASLFVLPVEDPSQYGVLTQDERGRPLALEEKPLMSMSRLAVTGLYVYDERAPDFAASLRPGARGELEITDLNRLYLERNDLHVEHLSEVEWFDTGTPDRLLSAQLYIQRQEQLKPGIGCPELAALESGLLPWEQFCTLAAAEDVYGEYLDGIRKQLALESPDLRCWSSEGLRSSPSPSGCLHAFSPLPFRWTPTGSPHTI